MSRFDLVYIFCCLLAAATVPLAALAAGFSSESAMLGFCASGIVLLALIGHHLATSAGDAGDDR